MGRYILFYFLVLFFCNNKPKSPAVVKKPINTIDTFRSISSYALILFDHETSKKSLIAMRVNTRLGIDSLLNFIGPVNEDPSCNQPGMYNRFGEILLFGDSMRSQKLAEIYFVLEGTCNGVYLKQNNNLIRHFLTPSGFIFLEELYKENEALLK
jgi:hypothetical protein